MKQVWKCEYCSETNIDSEVIANHESKCVLNPEYKVIVKVIKQKNYEMDSIN